MSVESTALFCVLLLTACGGASTEGKPTETSLTSFCSGLSSLSLAVANMRTLDPRSVASDHAELIGSYAAVRRDAPGDGVKLSPLTAAYKDYSQAVVLLQKLPVTLQDANAISSLTAPLQDLQAAIIATGKEARCPTLAVPGPALVTPTPTS